MLNIFTSSISALAANANVLRAPRGMWEWFLITVFGFIQNYGWRIIVFTIILKLVLSPLDFFQRYKMRKNQAITEKIKPELEKLEKQYKDDKRGYQAAQMQLQKAHGFSHFAACLPMILTLVVFFTFFAGMQNVVRFHEFSEYYQMHNVYQARFRQLTDLEYEYFDGDEEFSDYILGWFSREHEWVTRQYGDMSEAQTHALAVFNQHDNSFFNVVAGYYTMQEHINFLIGSPEAGPHLFVVAAPERLPPIFRTGEHSLLAVGANHFSLERLASIQAEGVEYWRRFVVDGVNDNLALRQDIPSGFISEFANFNEVMAHFAAFEEFRNLQMSRDMFLHIASMAAAYRVMTVYAEEIRTDFLWIRSIWLPDTPWARPVSDFDAFRNRVGNAYLGDIPPYMADGYRMNSYVHRELANERFYNDITRMVRANEDLSRRNGFLILAVLAIILSFGSQFLTRHQQKKSGQVPGGMGALGGAAGGGMAMKIMGFMMPALIGVFAVFQSSAFALYMIVNSAMTVIINLICTLIVNKIFSGKDINTVGKKGGGIKISYNSDGVQRHGRPDPTQFNK